MQVTSPLEIGRRLADLRCDPIAGPATAAALGYLADLFGRRNGQGVAMATRALRIAIPEAQVIELATSYVMRLREP